MTKNKLTPRKSKKLMPRKLKIDKTFERDINGRKLKIWRVENNRELALTTFAKLMLKLDGKELEKPAHFPTSNCRYSTKKHYNVFFSGGFDSLSLAIRHLKNGDFIDLYHVGFDPEERVFAEISCAILQSIYGNQVIGLKSVLNDEFVGAVDGDVERTFAQQRITTFTASLIGNDVLENTIATEIAYCMNDDAISFLGELKNFYNASLSCRINPTARAPLKFPLSKTQHITNSEVVYNFEDEKGVMFPVSEQYIPHIESFKTKDSTWLLMCPDRDVDEYTHHANKEVIKPTGTYIIRLDNYVPVRIGSDIEVECDLKEL